MSERPGRADPTDFWRVVFLLLGAARKRSAGRQKRQQELLRQRNKQSSVNWEGLAVAVAFFFAVLLNCIAAYVLHGAVAAGQKLTAEWGGKMIVSRSFKMTVEDATTAHSDANRETANKDLEHEYGSESRWQVWKYGGTESAAGARLRAVVRAQGPQGFLVEGDVVSGLTALPGSRSLPALLGSIVLLWWAVMLVLQGEGLELDLQRRRHPMWEWLFAHPVGGGAVFTAEMLSPIAANPMYWAAPFFVGAVYGQIYGGEDYGINLGVPAALLAGVPLAVAAACLGKALEIGSMIRFSPRSRGALLGLMSWFGYASMMLLFLGATSVSKAADIVGRFLEPLAALPWPWLGWFLGRQADGSYSFWAGMLACWTGAGVTSAAAVWFCVWGANQGLSGNYGAADALKPPAAGRVRFGKEPLYRKEFLWFIRDRSAIVQTILIPLTVAGFQLFNLRGMLQSAQGSWNYLCGAAILFGTYFLWVLGPKSLASEGSALWLALTWPRGLESLLKAKAWLWSMISTGIVTLTLAYAVYLFPAQAWKVALVGVGWLVFGRSMAEKTVTLVTIPSSSGDPEPIPRGRRWAASLGMLTFAVGVLTQQWTLAVVGVVYSHLTAAAIWENFRARLPFLYDPWSERLPPPPTLMHAMVAISILVELVAVLTVPALLLAGRENFAVTRAVLYGLGALAVSVGTVGFLRARGVRLADVWCWREGGATAAQATKLWCGDGSRRGNFWRALLTGAASGLALGLAVRGVFALLLRFPSPLTEAIRQSREWTESFPGWQVSYAFCAVAVAPFAEEYLFRGLLFRALDREWGGWRAVLGSAAFFAIYHPPLAWLPVGLVGAANALLFKRTGRLAPAVVLHLIYNTVILV